MDPRPFHIREVRLPDDKPAILRFIMGLQQFENLVDADRRIDAAVAEEFFAVLMARTCERNGCVLVAEDEHEKSLGWAVAYEDQNEIYVVEEERSFGHISELYVVEEARGHGVGRALVAACEDWAKARGLKTVMIGALAGNHRAFELYRKEGYTPYATQLRKYLR